jgi:transcriptional regulator with XRE-family HTH domain
MRQARGWSQGELGSRMQPPVSHAAVSDIERGVTHLTTDLLGNVAGAFGVECSVRIGDETISLTSATESAEGQEDSDA